MIASFALHDLKHVTFGQAQHLWAGSMIERHPKRTVLLIFTATAATNCACGIAEGMLILFGCFKLLLLTACQASILALLARLFALCIALAANLKRHSATSPTAGLGAPFSSWGMPWPLSPLESPRGGRWFIPRFRRMLFLVMKEKH